MKSVQGDGWPAVRAAVLARDGGCIATSWRIFGPDAAIDTCRSRFGRHIRFDDFNELEFDHVKENLATSQKPPDDEAHGVAVCPWHHRLSNGWRSDSKEHRRAARAWLALHYPEVWDAT